MLTSHMIGRTARFYNSDLELRISQEIILGVGGGARCASWF
jgi:hypothetical protein